MGVRPGDLHKSLQSQSTWEEVDFSKQEKPIWAITVLFSQKRFHSLLMNSLHVGWEWNFNYIDASFTFLSLTGDQTDPPTPTGRQVNRVHVLTAKWITVSVGWEIKIPIPKILFEGIT